MATAKRVDRSVTAPRGGVRDRILDAALAALGESGLRHFTQPQIAERAGVRQSHLTYYFPTRHDLLEALTARAVDGIASGVLRAVQREEREDDAAVIGRLATAVADLEHMRMFLGLIVEADGDVAARGLLVDGLRRLETVLAEALGGDDAPERARLVLAALWGLGLYQFVVRPPPKSDLRRPFASWLAQAVPVPRASRSRRPPAR